MTSGVLRLLGNARPAPEVPISAAEFAALPPPVARYLSAARVEGKRRPRTVHLLQSGEMLTAPGKRWIELKAEQWYSLDPPGFIWRGAIQANLLMRVAATDQFLDGRGSLAIRAWGKVPLGKASGPETDSAELLRFLAEVIWFPAYWLSSCITWQPRDERSARASMRVNEIEASCAVMFGDDGLACGLESRRYRTVGKRFELTPWFGRCDDYREANGVLIPHRIAVTWGLPQGDFEWLRVSVDRIEYA